MPEVGQARGTTSADGESEAETKLYADEDIMGKTCCECMLDFEGDGKRCNPCNCLRVRIYRAKDELQSGTLASFGNMSRDAKAEWFKESHDLCGEALVARIQETVENVKTESKSLEHTGKGYAFDSPDLAERYKNKKPEILENVRKNAKTFIHPLRKCNMYVDIDYESKHTEKEDVSTKRKLSVSTDRKRAKAKAKPTADDTQEPEAKKLTPADVKHLEKVNTSVTAMITESEGKQKVKTELGDLLPAYLMKQLDVTLAAEKTNMALIALFQGQEEGSMKQLKSQYDLVKQGHTKHMQVWNVQENMARAAKKSVAAWDKFGCRQYISS